MTYTHQQLAAAYAKHGMIVTIIGDVVEADRQLTRSEIDQALVEVAFDILRAERNRLLAECDWTVLSDTPTSTAAWKTYRQALRDLPANTTDPFNPEWPTPPN